INDLSDAKSGNNSYYIGLNSGTNNIGTYNVAVGDISMENATSAQGNVAIGSGSLKGLSTGKFNVGIGFNTGTLTTTGSENILIGSGLSTTSPTASNELNIGEAIYGTDIKGGNPRIGIGHTNSAPTSTLDIGGSISKPIVVKSENYTATDSDYTLIFSYITGTGEVILTLPDAIKSKGRIYVIRTTEVTTSNDRLVIRAHTGNTIEGLNDIEIGYQGLGLNSLEEVHAVTIQCDGSNWWIISATINN
ncbi:MAG: hypothetical protein KAH32_07195, partial [Chlamydiia bacterium]|nr:hypothetical protein [Chlamydiia bacterium]